MQHKLHLHASGWIRRKEHNQMKKLFALCLLPLCLLLCACEADAPQQEEAQAELLIGFSQLGSESSWRIGNTLSIQKAAQEHGINLMYDNALQKQENQIAQLRSFIAYQVDLIVFSPIVEDGWDNVLTEARHAGIPVILMDRFINTADDSLYTAYIGADFYMEGGQGRRLSAGKGRTNGQRDDQHCGNFRHGGCHANASPLSGLSRQGGPRPPFSHFGNHIGRLSAVQG